MSDTEEQTEDPNIHIVDIRRENTGYGFNIKGTTQEGGVLQAINGRLYPPLQYVSAVDENGTSYNAGLRKYDRILEVNGTDVQGATHARVVELVLAAGGHLVLRVLSVEAAEAQRLQRLEESYDEEKRKPAKSAGVVAVEVRSHRDVEAGNAPYTVFNIFVGGQFRCSRRYSEFVSLNKALKERFRWFAFPPLPPKKLNSISKMALGPRDLEERRKGLDDYVAKTFGVEDIFKSDIVQTFLKEEQDPAAAAAASAGDESQTMRKGRVNTAPVQSAPAPIPKVQVRLPGGKIIQVNCKPDESAAVVEERIAAQLGLGRTFGAHIFGLFEGDRGFYRKLEPRAKPAASSLLMYQRWLFTKGQEQFADEHAAAMDLLYQQALESVAKKELKLVPGAEAKLDSFAQGGEKLKYLKVARKLDGYGCVRFPPCKCDYPDENTTVKVTVGIRTLVINVASAADNAEGSDDDATEWPWEVVKSYAMQADGATVVIKYTTEDDCEETLNIKSDHAAFLVTCIERVMQEREWAKTIVQGDERESGNFFEVKPAAA